MNLNQRYPEQEKFATAAPKQATYMDNLMEQLEAQLKRLSDIDGRLYGIGSRVKANEPSPANAQKEGPQEIASGYLSTLSSKIDTFRVYNDSLLATVEKLEQAF